MRLEDFIKNNRDKFDDEEPLTGHLERFEQRLVAPKQNKRAGLRWIVAVAALLSGLVIVLTFFVGQQDDKRICVLSTEMQETQNYYLLVLDKEVGHVKELLNDVDDEIREEIMSDVNKIVSNADGFTDNFCNNSEDGIATMVDYYQAKIQAVKNISSIFESKNIM